MPYYSLTRDRENAIKYWYLSPPQQDDGSYFSDVWAFSYGKPAAVSGPIHFSCERAGRPSDLTFGAYGTLVATKTAADLVCVAAPDDVQLVDAICNDIELKIINPTRLVDCIDYERSTMQADSDGHPKMILDLKLDHGRIGNAKVFRLADWAPNLIGVSSVVYQSLSNEGLSGYVTKEMD